MQSSPVMETTTVPNRLVINIRGANASGKTTLARRFLAPNGQFELGEFHGVKVKANRTLPLFDVHHPVYVIGTYDDSKYSGCDKIKSAEAITEAVSWAACELPGHILFEGFRVSKSYERFATLRNYVVNTMHNHGWLWVFLNATLPLIIERSNLRREEGSRPADEKELGAVVRQMDNTRRKVRAAFPGESIDLQVIDPVEYNFAAVVNEIRRRENVS